jgi:hypothetical protein
MDGGISVADMVLILSVLFGFCVGLVLGGLIFLPLLINQMDDLMERLESLSVSRGFFGALRYMLCHPWRCFITDGRRKTPR